MKYSLSWVLNTTPLYRIMPLKWFKIMVEEKRNTLFRPSKWDDPYEMNYSNSVIATEKGDIPLDASYWFGQCWSLCAESAIMWQAFKKTKDPCVKIMVYADKLISGKNELDDELRIVVLDYIRYFEPTQDSYHEKLNDVISTHQWPKNFLSKGCKCAELFPIYSLLTKRNVFKHEEEVRFLLFDKSASKDQESFSYTFDPTIVKEVVIDPWTSKDDDKYLEILKELRPYLSQETTKIRKSEIFSNSSMFSIRYNP
ncbi:hypothetical protein SAMN06298211_102100 [Prevotellaceae bacterium MN60]|nr:hypothetical protein SAMN06298211_102100 [Prevotellaceae bacterium MN60]